ncbi:MAG: hypothetical protein ACYDGR_09780 [Candidatus Dormibacteria bacterium]
MTVVTKGMRRADLVEGTEYRLRGGAYGIRARFEVIREVEVPRYGLGADAIGTRSQRALVFRRLDSGGEELIDNIRYVAETWADYEVREDAARAKAARQHALQERIRLGLEARGVVALNIGSRYGCSPHIHYVEALPEGHPDTKLRDIGKATEDLSDVTLTVSDLLKLIE